MFSHDTCFCCTYYPKKVCWIYVQQNLLANFLLEFCQELTLNLMFLCSTDGGYFFKNKGNNWLTEPRKGNNYWLDHVKDIHIYHM